MVRQIKSAGNIVKKLAPLSLSIFLLAFSACDSERANGPSMPMPYQSEAEQIALYYSSECTPPAHLTWDISRELVKMRNAYGKLIPGINQPFPPPWTPNKVWVGFTDSVAQLVKSGNYPYWDSLISRYSVSFSSRSYFPTYFELVANVPVHAQLLAAAIRPLPGVEWAEVEDRPYDWAYSFAREQIDDVTNYYFSFSECPDLYYRLVWIQIKGSRVVLGGDHHECRRGLEDPREWEAYIDSAEVNRPAWVDEARKQLSRIIVYGPNNEWRNLYP